MSWTAYHRRGDVLRAVAEQIELRRDGTLPSDVPAPFRDSLDLVGALHFRWHHRLVSCLEQRLAGRETDLADAVADAWADAARSLPGLRAVLDAQLAGPADASVATALERATAKEHQLLATAAGRGDRVDQPVDARAVRLGGEIERAARARLTEPATAADPEPRRVPRGSASFVRRLKAVLAA